VAATVRARLTGLAGLRAPPPCGLLLLPTRSVHTFGMRFALDLVWLDARGRVVRVDAAVPPRRLRSCRAARAVIELPVGEAQRSSRAVAYASSRLTGSRTSDV
jgi:uncharacterized protein